MLITLGALVDFPGPDPGIRHAFFTRQGGVSGGLFASLNCGFGSRDAPDNVEQNRAIAAARLGLSADRLVSCHQIHGTSAITVEDTWRREENPRADAMVTAVPGIALGVLAADCAPVLFADPDSRIIGAAHGGWGAPRSSGRRTTRRPRRGCSSAIGAPACAANRITAAAWPPSRSRRDRA